MPRFSPHFVLSCCCLLSGAAALYEPSTRREGPPRPGPRSHLARLHHPGTLCKGARLMQGAYSNHLLLALVISPLPPPPQPVELRRSDESHGGSYFVIGGGGGGQGRGPRSIFVRLTLIRSCRIHEKENRACVVELDSACLVLSTSHPPSFILPRGTRNAHNRAIYIQTPTRTLQPFCRKLTQRAQRTFYGCTHVAENSGAFMRYAFKPEIPTEFSSTAVLL